MSARPNPKPPDNTQHDAEMYGRWMPGCAPLLKWVGGKSGLVDEMKKRMPPAFGRYFEPFAGGAALFFSLGRPRRAGAVLGDLNADLIETYRTVAHDTKRVIRRLSWLERTRAVAPSSHYTVMRLDWNRDVRRRRVGLRGFMSDVERAAAFLYLNRTCYNGMWRVNKEGAFNVPQGRYKNPGICDRVRINLAAEALRDSSLRSGPWQQTTLDARAGDLVYFDPPYVPVSPTARFTAYTSGGFGAREQAQLAEGVHALAARGVHVMVSNSDTPMVRELYRGMKMHRVKAARAINCKADGRGAVRELIITSP